jgi:hypothetical protein
MSEHRSEPLSNEEIEEHGTEPLPDREEMALIDANVAIPVNLALAANVLSEDAVAYANAQQDAIIDQAT